MNVTYCTQKGWRTLQQNCRHPPTEATLTYHPNPPPKACLRRRRLTPCLRRRVYGAARRYRRDSPANNHLNHARRTCDAFERPSSIVVVQGRHTTQPRRSTIRQQLSLRVASGCERRCGSARHGRRTHESARPESSHRPPTIYFSFLRLSV